MVFRLLRNPALLTSLAAHGIVAGAAILFAGVAAPVNRPALLLGVASSEFTGSIDAEAPPPPPEPSIVVEPIPDVVPDTSMPEEPAELPPSDDLPVAESMPVFFETAPVGVRNAVKAKAVDPPSVPPAVSTTASTAAPRPPIVFAPSRRGSHAETRSAQPIGNVPPPYPAEALRHHWEGTAILDVRVSAEGTVYEATIYESSGSRVLDDASIAAALTYRFSPRLIDGVPAPDWLRQPFTWKIRP